MDLLSEVYCDCSSCLRPATVTWCLCCRSSGVCERALDRCCACCCSALCQCCQDLCTCSCSTDSDACANVSSPSVVLLLLVLFCMAVGVCCVTLGIGASHDNCSGLLSVNLIIMRFGILEMAAFFLIYLKYYRNSSSKSVNHTGLSMPSDRR